MAGEEFEGEEANVSVEYCEKEKESSVQEGEYCEEGAYCGLEENE